MSRRLGILAIVILIVALCTSSFFVVNEGKKALLLNWGHVKENAAGQPVVLGPGLHFKWPFFTEAKQYDTRIQTLNLSVPMTFAGQALEGTANYVVYWQVTQFATCYATTGGEWQVLDTLLPQRLIGHLALTPDNVSQQAMLDRASELTSGLGVKVVAIRFKGYSLSQNTLQSVYQSMRETEEKNAKAARLVAKAEADNLLSDNEAQASLIRAKADADASQLRAEGDEQAAKIYSEAYAKDPAFYAFLIHLDAYANTFTSKQDLLVLTPEMAFLSDFNTPQPAQVKSPSE